MTEACAKILEYLDCETQVFSGEHNESQILAAYSEARREGAASGHTPLLIIPDDILAEAFELFLEDAEQEDSSAGLAKGVAEILKQAEDINEKAVLEARLDEYKEMSQGYDLVGQFIDSSPTDALDLTDSCGNPYPEIILAKIKASPAELAAWAPMGGFNDCPAPAEQVAIFRYWQEKYGSVPAVVSYDVWQLTVENPPLDDTASEALAWEHFAFCYDVVMQAPEEFASIRALASNLKGSKAWGFWWD